MNQKDDRSLDRDARVLQEALSELVRVYQFRDRKRICYYDVSVTQCYAVSALITGGPMTLRRLAETLYLDKSTTSRVVDSLEEKGYVHRSVDPDDARALQLEATEKGRKLHTRIGEDLVDEMKELIVDTDPDVRQETARLIERFTRSAKERFSNATSGS